MLFYSFGFYPARNHCNDECCSLFCFLALASLVMCINQLVKYDLMGLALNIGSLKIRGGVKLLLGQAGYEFYSCTWLAYLIYSNRSASISLDPRFYWRLRFYFLIT
jgi:hypothetical protein